MPGHIVVTAVTEVQMLRTLAGTGTVAEKVAGTVMETVVGTDVETVAGTVVETVAGCGDGDRKGDSGVLGVM